MISVSSPTLHCRLSLPPLDQLKSSWVEVTASPRYCSRATKLAGRTHVSIGDEFLAFGELLTGRRCIKAQRLRVYIGPKLLLLKHDALHTPTNPVRGFEEMHIVNRVLQRPECCESRATTANDSHSLRDGHEKEMADLGRIWQTVSTVMILPRASKNSPPGLL